MYKWVEEHKNDNSGFISFLKFIYAIGTNNTVMAIIASVLGIIIPIFFDLQIYLWFVLTFMLLIGGIVFNAVCTKYQEHQNKKQQIAIEALSNQNSLMNTINIEIKSNQQWKSHIFKKTSEIVCEKIQHLFKEVLHCSTRVSVEYVFNKTSKDKIERHVKMSGRRSPNRDTCKGSKPLTSRSKYYSYYIFSSNKVGISLVSENQINAKNSKWYKNPTHNIDIKEYIGIAVSVMDESSVDFILQIDCLHKTPFGQHAKSRKETEIEIETFINTYLKSYIDIVGLSYLLNLNKNKCMPEV